MKNISATIYAQNRRQWVIIIAVIVCASCRAPVSHINNLPAPSLLEQKGDLNLKANTGADFRATDLIYDFDAAWSPVSNWGMRSHITTKGNENFYSKLFYIDLAAVYYDSTSFGLNYELIFGYGWGNLAGTKFRSSQPPDHLIIGFKSGDYGYKIVSGSSRIFIQPSLNFPLKSEKHVKITTGLRLQLMDAHEYYYEKRKFWTVNRTFRAFTAEPFVASSYTRGHFGLTTTFGYSLNINNLQAPEYSHPVYKRFYYSIGVFLNLKSR